MGIRLKPRVWNSVFKSTNMLGFYMKSVCWWFQTLVKLSDGVFQNQRCLYTGTEAQHELEQYCSIKVLEYRIDIPDPVNYPHEAILLISNLEVVKTAEVRELILSRYFDDQKYFNSKIIQQNGNRKIGNPETWNNGGNFFEHFNVIEIDNF